MHIHIGRPCAVSEKGLRQNNEDFIFPAPESVTPKDRLFMVCDGVGGAEKGEIASSLACEHIATFFSSMPGREDPSDFFIQRAVQYAQAYFKDYIATHPAASDMATTLTLLYLTPSGATVAHIGDSRIYQFRRGRIIFRTEDHSLVNSWVKAGMISPDDAHTHPMKNVITRAIQAESGVSPDVARITDVQTGDYFFLCSDGILESFTDEALEAVFAEQRTAENIKDVIVESCAENSRDNFSFYIIPIHRVQTDGSGILSFLYSFV
jgi:protein phosphatase